MRAERCAVEERARCGTYLVVFAVDFVDGEGVF